MSSCVKGSQIRKPVPTADEEILPESIFQRPCLVLSTNLALYKFLFVCICICIARDAKYLGWVQLRSSEEIVVYV